MKIVSATLLAVSFLLALVFGAQTAEWSWGPALVALALAVAAGAFAPGVGGGGRWVAWAMLPAAGWIFFRGMNSAVSDFARADGMLVLAVLGPALVIGGLRPGNRSLPWVFAGLAVVAILNLGVAVAQSQNPGFTWPYHQRPSDRMTGFFGHYNYFSCFNYTVALLLAARGLFARDHPGLRSLFIITAMWSAAMVPLSGSRGGTLALAVGAVVLLSAGAILAWRHGARWAKWFLLLFPLLLVGAVALGWTLLAKVQEERGGDGGLLRMADNSGRLERAELALSVAADHPLTGGGSRAYSWKRNDHWDVRNFGRGAENERFVHHELLQLLTDYGLVGVVLVLLPIGVVGWLALSRLFLGGDEGGGHLDAIAAGVLAAGAAILMQANFSFVFHMLPLAMLFGVLFGLGGLLAAPRAATLVGRSLRATAAGVLVLVIGFLGVRASRTLWQVWPVMYEATSEISADPEAAIGRMEMAVASWPGHRLLEEAGHFCRIAAADVEEDPEARRKWNLRAVAFYRRAIPRHPHHPGLELNLANALSDLGEDQPAEQAYLRAIDLQGGLEAAFEARYFYARHLYVRWHARWTDPAQRRAAEALWHFEQALALLDEAKAETLWEVAPQKALRERLEQAIDFLREARVSPRAPDEGVTE